MSTLFNFATAAETKGIELIQRPKCLTCEDDSDQDGDE